MEQQQTSAERGGRRFHLNPAIVAALIGLIGAVAVAVISAVISRPPDPCFEPGTGTGQGVEITSPKQDDKVKQRQLVRGIAPIGEDLLWVMYRPFSGKHYYPIENEIRPDLGPIGAWSVRAFIGDEDDDIGETFNLIVVKTSGRVYKMFQDYNDEGLEQLPRCAIPVDQVRVERL